MQNTLRRAGRRSASLVAAVVFFLFLLMACLPHAGHAKGHFCPICQVARLPVLQPALPATSMPILAVRWLERSANFDLSGDVAVGASSSRGPPA